MKPRQYDPPLLGDIRTLIDYPQGTPLPEITEFEIWDGAAWIDSKDAEARIYDVGFVRV